MQAGKTGHASDTECKKSKKQLAAFFDMLHTIVLVWLPTHMTEATTRRANNCMRECVAPTELLMVRDCSGPAELCEATLDAC